MPLVAACEGWPRADIRCAFGGMPRGVGAALGALTCGRRSFSVYLVTCCGVSPVYLPRTVGAAPYGGYVAGLKGGDAKGCRARGLRGGF